MKLLDLYTSILECGGLSTDEEGYVSVKFNGKSTPALINGKRLVLPTQKQLTANDWNEKIRFHPLSENILRGESEVIVKLRNVFNIRLNSTFAVVAHNLLKIITSIGEQHKLTPEQSEILSAVKNIDEDTLIAFTKVMLNAVEECPDKVFINIFLKRGGTVNGKKHSRVGVVTFPLYEDLLKNNESYYGVKLRPKDRAGFIQLFEYMLPNLDKEEAYNFGSDSGIAPFLDALMGSVLGIASKMNDILELFGKLIDDGDSLVFASEWVETFEDLSVMVPQIRQIPVQHGNEGSVKVTESSQPALPVPAPAPLQNFQPPPQQQHQNPYQPAPAPVYHPHQHAAPQFQQPQQPAGNGLVVTDHGLDFNSVLRNNPRMAMAAMPFGGQPQMSAAAMHDNQTPRWAQPQFPQQQFQQPQFQQPYQQPYQQPMQSYPNNVYGSGGRV